MNRHSFYGLGNTTRQGGRADPRRRVCGMSVARARLRIFPMGPRGRIVVEQPAGTSAIDRGRRLVHRVGTAGYTGREARASRARARPDGACPPGPARAPTSPGRRPLPIRIQAGGYCGEDHRRNPVAEQLAAWPLEIRAPRPGQGCLNVRWAARPERTAQWGSVRSGGGDARGKLRRRPRARAARGTGPTRATRDAPRTAL